MITISARAKSVIEKDCYRSAMVALNRKGGRLHYGPSEWVPDEYETLERVGLVHCEFGRQDAFNKKLKARDITLTKAGAIAVQDIIDAIIPSYVTHSFHSALSREQTQAMQMRA